MRLIFVFLAFAILFFGPKVVLGQDMNFTLEANRKPVEVKFFQSYYYATFDLDRETTMVLTSKNTIHNCEISPLHRNIKSQIEGHQIFFTLREAGYFMVRINDTVKFFVFAEVPKKTPRKNVINILSYGVDTSSHISQTEQIQRAIDDAARSRKILLFPKGTYTSGQLALHSNSWIYLDRGALLQADVQSTAQYLSDDKVKTRKFIYIKDSRNVKISGYGTISGNGTVLRSKFGDEARMRLIMAVNSHNLVIEGVELRDPGSWNTQVLLCRNVLIKNVKLLNNKDLSNTDGFDPDASEKLRIIHCFAICSDDNVAIKTTNYGSYLGDVRNITVRGNVFLTRKSSLKIGTETMGKTMRNINFKDNDVLECDRGMALYVLDGATLNHIRYINNRFERNYPDAKRAGFYFQINRRNENSAAGQIKNVLIKDCTFKTTFPKPSKIEGLDPAHGIENMTIDNLVIEKKRIHSLQEGRIEVNEFVRNITFR